MVNNWPKIVQRISREKFSCLLCQVTCSERLCSDCHKDLPWLGESCCENCSEPLVSGKICGSCIKSKPAFDHCLSLFHYSGTVEWMIKHLKFHHGLIHGAVLGKLMADFLPHREQFCRPDVILPVPLHLSRLKSRGYNQAYELARPIGRKLGVDISISAVERVLATSEQSGLPSRLRRKNVANAFKVKEDFSDMCVAIVDDVMTTGATVNAIAYELKKAKAQRVVVWSVARS